MKSCYTKVVILTAAVAAGCRSAPGMTGGDDDITPGDFKARVTFLASDMLKGRDTPSHGLDVAATYIATEFRRVGLERPPGGDYVQRYQLARTELGDGWSLALVQSRRRVTLSHNVDFWGVPWAAGAVEGPIRFVGPWPPSGEERGEPAFWIVQLSSRISPREWLGPARDAGALGILFVLPPGFQDHPVGQWLDGDRDLYELGDLEPTVPAALIREESLHRAMAELGLEARPAVAAAQGPPLSASLSADLRVETAVAPNVMGILRGSDPELRNEYVLVSAHMDHLGVGAALEGDSIYNGADDNASGTAAVLEIAEAVASLEVAPKRSLLFLTVSGEEKGLLGSAWFVHHPPIPLDRIVANLNIDMIGRNWEDTIAVIGKPYSSLGSLIDSVAGARPDLNLTVVGDLWPAARFFWRSDHFNFARKGIPALFFFNGVHEDYHRPSDEVDKIKEEKAARITRLILEVALAVANAEEPPRWDPRAEAAIVERSP